MKKEVKKGLAEAKKLEKIPLPSMDEIVKTYRDGLKQAEKLRELLKPVWFLQDEKKAVTRRGKRKVYKPKSTASSSGPTRAKQKRRK